MGVGFKADSSRVLAGHKRIMERIIKNHTQTSHRVGDMTRDEVRQVLKENILRPRESEGILSEAITSKVSERAGDIHVGIGDREEMTKKAPYWRLQDEGGWVPPRARVVPGWFVNEAGARVPFKKGFVPTPDAPSGDLFIHSGKLGWMSPRQYASMAGDIAPFRSIMYVRRPIRAKHFFGVGFTNAKAKARTMYRNSFSEAFR